MIRCHIGAITVSLFVLWSGGCLSWLALIFHYSAHFSLVQHNSQSACSWTPMMTAFGFWTAPHILSRTALSQLFYWLQESGIMAHLWQTEAELIWRWLNVAKERNDSRQGNKWHVKYRGEDGKEGTMERRFDAGLSGKKKKLHSSKAKEKGQLERRLKVMWRRWW